MTQIKETVGRLPIYKGEYDSNKTYKKKNRVTLFGSEFQSLIDNNTYAPATLSADETHIIFDETHWKVISNGSDAFLNHRTVLEKLEEIDSKQASMQSEINGKQLEIGAVQTDIVPTQGSENHMTSGAIYETLKNPASGFVEDTTPDPEGDKLVNEALVAGMYGSYTENPEWVWVMLDSQKHVLGGFKTDGRFEFNAGVPTPIREYIAAQLESFVTEISNKVDKEDGKGLIIVDFADGVSYDENPEWVFVQLDAEGKVLSGIRNDGTNFISRLEVGEFVDLDKLIAKFGNSYYNVSLNHTELESKVYYHPNAGWKQVEYDSSAYPYDEADTYNVGEVCNVEGDTEHSYESTARQQGNYPAYTTVALHVTEKLDLAQALEKIPSDVLSGFVAGQVITFVDNDDIVEKWELQNDETWEQLNHFVINDIEERLSMELDTEGKVVSYRKKDGTLVENAGIETNHLELTKQGMSDFQQALKNAGFTPGGGGDWSDREVIELPEPKHYALLNIDIDYLPTASGDVREAAIQYYDGLGNYFKMDAEIEIQGQTSRIFAQTGGKGNYTLDLPKDVKFGKWVPQDSFHLKGCAKDVVRGILPTSYKWAYLVQEYLNAKPNRVLVDESDITETNATGKRINDWPNDARCLPDGFPVEVYVNGEYWGLYSWQLKKHRKNYSMDKKDYTSFFLDADQMMTDDYTHGLWNDGPDDKTYRATGWWTGFDIKGPKDLVCMDGSAFDGDHPKELIDETSEFYDASNKAHKGSRTTKNLIRSMSTRYNEVRSLINDSDIATAKEKFNEYFDYDACMLVYIYNCLMKNGDSVKKNTLWGMYSSGKIFPALWDLDGMYGTGWVGDGAGNPSSGLWNGAYATAEWPLKLFKSLYDDEIKAAYSELRDSKVVSLGTWHDIVFNQWVNRIGEEAYNRDIKKWPETPSYRKNYTDTEHWQQLGWTSSPGSTPVWEEGNTYNEGTIVVIKSHPMASGYVVWMRYKALVTTDTCPVTKFYDEFPIVGGFYDSPKRWEKWIDKQIVLCDVQNDYNLEDILADFIAYRNTDTGYEIACFNMSITSSLTKEYNYIQGHITRHETVIEGQTVSTYTIDGGAETPEDTSKTYTTVMAAIEAAASQPVDVPSENVYYIQARAKNINYHKK